MGPKNPKKKSKLTEEEKILRAEQKLLEEEEAKRRKEEMLTQFLKDKLSKEERNTKFNSIKLQNQWRVMMREGKKMVIMALVVQFLWTVLTSCKRSAARCKKVLLTPKTVVMQSTLFLPERKK